MTTRGNRDASSPPASADDRDRPGSAPIVSVTPMEVLRYPGAQARLAVSARRVNGEGGSFAVNGPAPG
jgi:hypothetical protein